jgi:hypothetical protein
MRIEKKRGRSSIRRSIRFELRPLVLVAIEETELERDYEEDDPHDDYEPAEEELPMDDEPEPDRC